MSFSWAGQDYKAYILTLMFFKRLAGIPLA